MEKGKKPLDSALDYNNIETKILIYEDRVKEWFLKIGVKLKQDNEAGFVILQIATSYIEGNQVKIGDIEIPIGMSYREGLLKDIKTNYWKQLPFGVACGW